MDLGLKRVLLVLLSISGGIVMTFGILGLLNVAYNAGVTFERYGSIYFVLTALPLALFCFTWLDYFLGTNILRIEEKAPQAQDE